MSIGGAAPADTGRGIRNRPSTRDTSYGLAVMTRGGGATSNSLVTGPICSAGEVQGRDPVSYTHLTLPTN